MFSRMREDIQCVFERDPAARDAARVAAATARIAAGYERLDGELDGREHLCGAFGHVPDFVQLVTESPYTHRACGCPKSCTQPVTCPFVRGRWWA